MKIILSLFNNADRDVFQDLWKKLQQFDPPLTIDYDGSGERTYRGDHFTAYIWTPAGERTRRPKDLFGTRIEISHITSEAELFLMATAPPTAEVVP